MTFSAAGADNNAGKLRKALGVGGGVGQLPPGHWKFAVVAENANSQVRGTCWEGRFSCQPIAGCKHALSTIESTAVPCQGCAQTQAVLHAAGGVAHDILKCPSRHTRRTFCHGC